jgi:glycosyltransferase involved in cell wall biosynthesis
MMAQCAALLIINHPLLDRALPTKLFDYLATGRPILVYGNGESEMSDLVLRLGAGMIVAEGDDEALNRALRQVRERPASDWQTARRLKFLEQHTRAAMAERMLAAAGAARRAHTRSRTGEVSNRDPRTADALRRARQAAALTSIRDSSRAAKNRLESR